MQKIGSVIGWLLVVLIGVFSLGTVAISRGEHVNALWLVTAALCIFAVAYRFHSAWLMAKVLTLTDRRCTPAYTCEDGRDYVPTNRWVVFGHHFAAIAGPGPLVGPVLAAQFGYLPGSLWILVGATLGGAVHDSIIMFCSARRNGKSLAEMVRDEIGTFAGTVALVSTLAILIIIIAVLALVVVKALAESPWGLFTIVMTIPIAMVMGSALRFWCPNQVGWVSTLGAIALLASVWGGGLLKDFPAVEHFLTADGKALAWGIIAYGFAASMLPVWLLLAPRDYLSTFMKIGTIAALSVAVIFLAPEMKMPAITKFVDGSGPVFAGPVFPFCFITIACGAISGFHALISSGTTPKLIRKESDIRLIGYGAMVTEMLVALMALISAASLEPGQYFAINMKGDIAEVTAHVTSLGFPVTVTEMETLASDLGEKNMIGRTGGAPTFAVGMALMFAKVLKSTHALALWYHFAIMFEALFILTTIDAGTRVGRCLMQDFLGHLWKPLGPGSVASDATASTVFIAAWGWFLYQGVVDPLGGINSLWPIFGVANQLLAVIALSFGITVLIKMGKARYAWVAALPLSWLLCVTMTAGFMKIFSADPKLGFLSAAADFGKKIAAGGDPSKLSDWKHLMVNNYINAGITGMFLVLVLLIVAACAREWFLLLSGKKTAELHEAPFVEASAY